MLPRGFAALAWSPSLFERGTVSGVVRLQAFDLRAIHFDDGRGGDDPAEPAFFKRLLPYVLEGLPQFREQIFRKT